MDRKIRLEMVEGNQFIFDFNNYEDFIIFLQKNEIVGKWRLNLCV